jgi:spore coat protein U-like protein
MKTCLCLLLVLLLLPGGAAEAAISCNISSPGFSASYSGTASVNQSSITINCSRLSTDPTTASYSAVINSGLYGQGSNLNGAFGTNRLAYREYKDSTCSTQWRSNGQGPISGTINFLSGLSASVSVNFWACIAAGLTYVPGNYTDTVTMTLSYNNGTGSTNNATATGTHSVLISTTGSCSISTAPGTVSFAYTAFQDTAANASTTFGTTCTNTLAYSLSVDSSTQVVGGLNYSLALGTTSSGGSVPLAATGSGVQQIFYINGTMPAEQAGSCTNVSCIATRMQTLTVSF